MRKFSAGIFVLFILCSCAGTVITPNRGVTVDNVYYSTAQPEIRIRINTRFEHVRVCDIPGVTSKECFHDFNSSDIFMIGTAKGLFDPEKVFSDREMISTGMTFIDDIPFFVGTDVYYSVDFPTGYYLRRRFAHYSDKKHIFFLLMARPLPKNSRLQWTNPNKFTKEQLDLIEAFVKSEHRFFTED